MNLQLLMMEIYNAKHDLNPSFIKQIFEEKALPNNLRCSDKLKLPKAKATDLGIDTVRCVPGKAKETLPPKLKNQTPLKCQKAYKNSQMW